MKQGMTDKQAQRLIDWLLDAGFTNEKANEALAYVMGVKEKGSQPKSNKN